MDLGEAIVMKRRKLPNRIVMRIARRRGYMSWIERMRNRFEATRGQAIYIPIEEI